MSIGIAITTFAIAALLSSGLVMFPFLTVYAEKNNDNDNDNHDDKNNDKAKLDCVDAATVLVVAVVGAAEATEDVDEVLDEGDIGNIFDINENEIENLLDKLEDQCEDEESERLIGFAENQRGRIGVD
jgi:CBS-domain-containing membrane protein